MGKRKSSFSRLFIISTFLAISLTAISYAPALADYFWKAPIPLNSAFELTNMTYTYDPATQTLTKNYTFKNVSGINLPTTRLVNLFLWSNNNICSNGWATMVYDGTSDYSNIEQDATVVGNDGLINWSSAVYLPSLSSTQLFPALPVQTVQPGISYPYWESFTGWPKDTTKTFTLNFSNVPKCNFIQNVVWIIYEEPTLIELTSFLAFPGNGNVKLVWRTETEIDNAGFNIYRAEEGSEERVKINDSLIPAKGNETAGAKYAYTDKGVEDNVTYLYWLEDVDLSGSASEHGPLKVTPQSIFSLR